MARRNCSDTRDCFDALPDRSLSCFETPAFSNETFFCDCSNLFGWIGEECDEVSLILTLMRISNIFSLFVAVGIITWMSYVQYLHYEHGYKKGMKLTPIFYTGILVLLQTALSFALTIFTIRASFDYNFFEIDDTIGFGENQKDVVIAVKFQVVISVLLSFKTVVQALIAVQITATWVHLINGLRRIFPNILSPEKMRIFVAAVLVISAVVCFPLSILRLKQLLGGLFTITALGISGLFFWASYKLNKALSMDMITDFQPVIKVVRFVKYSAAVHVVILVALALNTIVWMVTYQSTEENVKPGTFNPSAFLRDVGIYLTYMLLIFESWYCHRITKNCFKLDSSNRSKLKNAGETSNMRISSLI